MEEPHSVSGGSVSEVPSQSCGGKLNYLAGDSGTVATHVREKEDLELML
jgi:hypothetical protein